MTSGAKQSKEAVAPRVSGRRVAKRDPASLALIELRKALKMSQAEFAIKLMDVAPITVYRLETTDPPRGDTLLRLAEIADKAPCEIYSDEKDPDEPSEWDVLQELRDRLLGMFLDDVVSRIGVPFFQIVEKGKRRHAFLLMRLNDTESMGAAYSFVTASKALHSDDAAVRSEAQKVLSTFDRAVGNKLSYGPPRSKKHD